MNGWGMGIFFKSEPSSRVGGNDSEPDIARWEGSFPPFSEHGECPSVPSCGFSPDLHVPLERKWKEVHGLHCRLNAPTVSPDSANARAAI